MDKHRYLAMHNAIFLQCKMAVACLESLLSIIQIMSMYLLHLIKSTTTVTAMLIGIDEVDIRHALR
jgi:hypothetical protein